MISDGPYRFVRHPGYTAAFVMIVASGVALGSWLATLIALVGMPLLLRRMKYDHLPDLPPLIDSALPP